MRARITYETNAVNDYFSRLQNKGVFTLNIMGNGKTDKVQNYSLNLQNGKATLSVRLPEGSIVGDVIEYESKVIDASMVEPFVNKFVLTVTAAQQIQTGGNQKAKPPVDKAGRSRELTSGLALPDINEVYESGWGNRKHKFDQYSALEIIQEEASEAETPDNGGTAVYSFWVNMDNVYFKTECKSSKEDPEILKARWIYGLALIGMALIQADTKRGKKEETERPESQAEEDTVTLEERVFQTSAAVGPVLLPLVESLGSLTDEQVAIGSQVGDND